MVGVVVVIVEHGPYGPHEELSNNGPSVGVVDTSPR